jgi:hypothetical protein
MFPAVFKGMVEVDGEEFLILVGGGRIPVEYKEQFLYVKTGRAPEEWVRGFLESKLLSQSRLEEAKLATY